MIYGVWTRDELRLLRINYQKLDFDRLVKFFPDKSEIDVSKTIKSWCSKTQTKTFQQAIKRTIKSGINGVYKKGSDDSPWICCPFINGIREWLGNYDTLSECEYVIKKRKKELGII